MGIVCASGGGCIPLINLCSLPTCLAILGWTIAHIPNLLSFLSAIYSLPTMLGLLLLTALHFKGATHETRLRPQSPNY